MRRVKESSYIEEVKILNDRLIYLNNLRVGVGKFYVLIAGAIFASSVVIESLDLLTVLMIGIRFLGMAVEITQIASLIARRARFEIPIQLSR